MEAHLRIMWDVPSEGPQLLPIWQRIKQFVPEQPLGVKSQWSPYGINNRFRFYKYTPNHQFKKHYDGAFHQNEQIHSFLSMIIYLNSNFSQGQTVFWVPQGHHNPNNNDNQHYKSITITPKTGMAVLFHHAGSTLSPLHAGTSPVNGNKYILRTDVMYKRAGGVAHESAWHTEEGFETSWAICRPGNTPNAPWIVDLSPQSW